jgi:small conductance mechanosensitive channel
MRGTWLGIAVTACMGLHASIVGAQLPELAPDDAPAGDAAGKRAPARVDVQPETEDRAIAERLRDILAATGWFDAPKVQVRDGVVFLRGEAQSEQRRQWASELSRNTEDVVAVVNQMELRQEPVWDLTPGLLSLGELVRKLVQSLPAAIFALLVLLITWLASRGARVGVERLTRKRVQNGLLRKVIARASAVLVLLFGVYAILYVSGLTRLALSVLGGTGLIGLVLGIAFRDITENFLASIFLSVQQPFRVDDLVEIEGITGYVQRTTFRTTVLMTLAGNQVQVPNATVYKAIVRNFSTNQNRREDFFVGIGVDEPVSRAQSIALHVLADHPAVLSDPEPWVLVDSLGSATVQLRVYFWLDGSTHSYLKVRSSVIRLIKRALQDANVSLPDEAREVVFPDAVPIRMMEAQPAHRAERPRDEAAEVATDAEGRLGSEARELKRQAEQSRSPDAGENLLGTPQR